MKTREEIDIILTEYNFDRMSFDEAKKKLLDMVDTHHKQKMAELMPSEVQEAIDFIEENPSEDAFVSDNVRHFMNYGEADDNSIQLANEWNKELSKVINWTINFKSTQEEK